MDDMDDMDAMDDMDERGGGGWRGGGVETDGNEWMKKKNEIRPLLKTKFKEHYNMPRQKLPETFWQTGTYDFFKINYKKKIQSISGNKIVFYQLKNKNNIDVDNFSDYEKLKKVLK